MTKLLQHIEEMRAASPRSPATSGRSCRRSAMRSTDSTSSSWAASAPSPRSTSYAARRFLASCTTSPTASACPGSRRATQAPEELADNSESASSVRGAGGRPPATSLHLEAREAAGLVSHKADRTLRPLPRSSPLWPNLFAPLGPRPNYAERRVVRFELLELTDHGDRSGPMTLAGGGVQARSAIQGTSRGPPRKGAGTEDPLRRPLDQRHALPQWRDKPLRASGRIAPI